MEDRNQRAGRNEVVMMTATPRKSWAGYAIPADPILAAVAPTAGSRPRRPREPRQTGHSTRPLGPAEWESGSGELTLR